MYNLILIIALTLCSATGTLFLKFSSNQLKKDIKKLYHNFNFWMGLFLYVLASIIFLFALESHDLSKLYPLTSLSYIWVSLLSMKFLGESMTKSKWSGVSFILLGIILITL